MAELSVQNLTKDFGAERVLHDVTFTVADGEFVALVGPSGCGKSTLLRMIAGLEDISGGTITIGGQVVNAMEPKLRDIAMVFQNYALYPHMSVRENMGFSLKLRGATPSDLSARVEEAARVLGLADLLDRMPRALSGGQRQRVAMGRAIVRDPAVFLFDEPLSNLDAALRVQMRAEIRALHERLGSTSIFVTHDQVEAMTMADRIVVLHAGRLEQQGPPLQLYDQPANVFVAGFIGSPAMNLLPGEAEAGVIRLAPDLALPSITPHRGRVTWGIRPEHLALASPGPGTIPARVTALERTGHATFITVRAAGLTLSALTTTRPDLSRDAEVHLFPEPGCEHIFDPATGARL